MEAEKGGWKMEYKIVTIKERPDLCEEAAQWFHSKWEVPADAYLESMKASLLEDEPVPGWYLCLCGDTIIGGAGIIENDFHNRTDLTPNLCALYVEEAHRCRGVARKLLSYICEDMKNQGVGTLYLVTEHTSFYERYGWIFLRMVTGEDGGSMRMYVHPGK